MKTGWIKPDWPAPATVEAWVTTRSGGVSVPPWDTLNLGLHVGDLPTNVRRNRALVKQQLPVNTRLQWLNQVHSTRVVQISTDSRALRRRKADAAVVSGSGIAAVVMTADCLPVFLCDSAGSVAAVAHAGWRGLLDGILENTITALGVPASTLLAWLGPAIAPCHFQVGSEVRSAFLARQRETGAAAESVGLLDTAFTACPEEPGKRMVDIDAVATLRLRAAGLFNITGGGLCTVCDHQRFFSYRRDGVTGRMASLIYLKH